MSQTQEFTIKHCSSESPSHPSRNLQNWHSGQAWKSGEFPESPVQLIIQLKRRCKVDKIQILGHQYMIPQKVILYIGDFTARSEKKLWRKVGFFTFLENPNEDQRELKTINLKSHIAMGQYIKFEIYEPYNKKTNLFNKVAVDAINILGEELRNEAEILATQYLRKVDREEEQGQVKDSGDAGVKIKLDAETDLILSRMIEEKSIAEEKEDFDMAANLKNVITATKVVGEQIYQCDLGKNLKVKQEEYEEAKGFKIRRDELKLRRDRNVNEQLYQYGFSVDYFLQRLGSSESTEVPLEEILSNNTEDEYLRMNSKSKQHTPEGHSSADRSINIGQMSEPPESEFISEFDGDQPPRTLNISQINNTNESYSDPFSTAASGERSLANNQRTFEEILAAELAKEAARNGRPPTPDHDGPLEIAEKNTNLNKFEVLIFGEDFCIKANDKSYTSRLDAATDLQRIVEEDPVEILQKNELSAGKGEQKDLMRALLVYIEKFLEDRVKDVYLSGIEAAKRLINATAQYQPQEVNSILEMVLPILLRRSQEDVHNLDRQPTKAHRQNEFIEAILDIHAMLPAHKTPLYLTKLYTPLKHDFKTKKKAAPPKLYWSRLEILNRVITEQMRVIAKHWRQDRLFEETFRIINEGLRHQNGQVRHKASALLYLLYHQSNEQTRQMFDDIVRDDQVSTNNRRELAQSMIDSIYDEFDRLDGKPTKKQIEAERKRQDESKKRAEQAEIEQLSKQLAAAKAANRDQGQLNQPTQREVNRPAPTSDQFDDEEDEGNKQCIFCLEFDETFGEDENEKGMDMHYWKECPMLTKCKECKMVIEISGYNEHLIRECTAKEKFIECDKCEEAAEASLLQKHQKSAACLTKKDGKAVCPMCQLAVSDSEEGWRQHLMSEKGCKKNPRLKDSLKRKAGK